MVSLVIKNLCFWIVSLSQAEKCEIKPILKYKSVKNSLDRRTPKNSTVILLLYYILYK